MLNRNTKPFVTACKNYKDRLAVTLKPYFGHSNLFNDSEKDPLIYKTLRKNTKKIKKNIAFRNENLYLM